MALTAALLAQLGARFGDRLATSASVRSAYAGGESVAAGEPPAAVVFARSTAEVAALVAACRQARVPVITRGAGTSLEALT